MSDWQAEQEEYELRRSDSVDTAWFLLWLMLAATAVAAVREVVFG